MWLLRIVEAVWVFLSGLGTELEKFDEISTLPGTISRPWLNYSLPIEERVDSLVEALSLEEKCSQLVTGASGIARLGVPAYHYRNNILHGLVDNGISTMFPQAIGLAATFDVKLLHQIADIWSTEQRAKHHHQTSKDSSMNFGLDLWGPNINMFVHSLWGRGQETYGEDPYLTSTLASVVIEGLQEERDGVLKTIATPKHFAAYTIDKEPPRLEVYENISSSQLLQYYFPAFRNVVKAGAGSIMCSYNGIETVYHKNHSKAPMCMSPLLKQVLRDDFGFRGYIVTDSGALDFMVTKFKRFKTYPEAAVAAIRAGVDLNSGNVLNKPLLEAVRNGAISETDLTPALRNVFTGRIKMGTFNPPEADPFSSIPVSVLNSKPHRDVALASAQRSVVLLKNNGVLPLLDKGISQIAVIGPAAADQMRMAGNYYGCSYGTWGALLKECNIETPLQGIERVFAKKDIVVNYALGVEQESNSTDGLSNALELAQNSDVTIAFVGLRNCRPGYSDVHCESEGRDRTHLNLPGIQHYLLKRLSSVSKKLIVVVSGGGPVSLYWEARNVDAMMLSWYGGALGAQAVAETLLGVVSPSGRLPVTFPTNMSQVADPLGMDLTDGRSYQFMKQTPLYAFGYGLSYVKFTYSDASVEVLKGDREIAVCVKVLHSNGSVQSSDEVVMVFSTYVGDIPVAAKPLKQLVGYERVQGVQRGESRRVCVTVKLASMYLVEKGTETMKLLPGAYVLHIGGRAPGKIGYFVDSGLVQEPLKVSFDSAYI